VRLTLRVRELVVASWATDTDSIARAVYPGLEPAESGGRHLVSIAALRFAGGRLGVVPIGPFSQLNVRAYVHYEGRPAVYFLRSYVSLGGLGGALLGAPFRAARIRMRPGRVDVPAAGLSLAYTRGERADAGELGAHEVGLFEAAGLRAFRIKRGHAEWRRARPSRRARADVLLALGFAVEGDPEIAYAEGGSFAFDVPARRVR
jgi:uncharacterized protein YqjF (DUF2071 family)